MDEGKIEDSCEIVINSSPGHVFTILADLEQYLAWWAKGPVAVKKLTDGSTTSGTRFEVTARVAGLPARSPYTVTACERDRRFAGQGIAGPVRFSEEYRLHSDQMRAIARGCATRCGPSRAASSNSRANRSPLSSDGCSTPT